MSSADQWPPKMLKSESEETLNMLLYMIKEILSRIILDFGGTQ